MDNPKKIIDIIKNENIRPTPGWVFTAKRLLTWSIFSMTILLGSLAFAVILFTIQESDFSITSHMGHSGVEFFLSLLPIIWLVFVVIFLGMAILSIRNSWKGYKFSLLKQVSISVGMSIALGTLLFILGGGKWIEKVYDVNVSSYESLEERKQNMWSRPDEGYLSGTISSIEDNNMTIVDFNGQQWRITDLESSFIANAVMLENGELIKLIGESEGDNVFSVKEIRPWGGRGNNRGINKNSGVRGPLQ